VPICPSTAFALTGPNQWAVHVPLGKLKTERMVPVDPFVCELVRRLQFFRFLDPLPADGRLLARPRAKEALVRQLRDYLHQGLPRAWPFSPRIVPISFAIPMPRRCFELAWLARGNETTWSHFSRDDHAIP